MSFTAYRTWIGGELVDQNELNQQVRDNGNVLKTSIADDGSLKGPLKGYNESKQTIAIAAGVVNIDYSLGNHIEIALNANITSFVLTNVPIVGANPVVIYFTGDGTPRTVAYSITANGHTTTAKFPGNVPLTNPTSTNGKVDEVLIATRDAWVTTWGKVLGQNS